MKGGIAIMVLKVITGQVNMCDFVSIAKVDKKY